MIDYLLENVDFRIESLEFHLPLDEIFLAIFESNTYLIYASYETSVYVDDFFFEFS